MITKLKRLVSRSQWGGREPNFSEDQPRFRTGFHLSILFAAFAFAVGSLVYSQGPPVEPGEQPPLLQEEVTRGTEISPAQGASVREAATQAFSRPFQVGAAGDMIGFSHSDGSGTQTITLIHTGKSWMAVYHINKEGMIRLISSRPIDADFSLELNATSPLPDQIRRMNKSSQ